MKILPILAALALGSATAAYADTPAPAADNVPLCSRTVTDNCLNPSQASHAARHAKAKAHHKAAHRAHHEAAAKAAPASPQK